MSENAALGYEIMQLRGKLEEIFSRMVHVRKETGYGKIIVSSADIDKAGKIVVEYINNKPTLVRFNSNEETLGNIGHPDEIIPSKEYIFPFCQVSSIEWDKKN